MKPTTSRISAQVAQELKKALVLKHRSLLKAAKALRISRMGIYKVLNGQVRSSRIVLDLLCSDLGINPSIFVAKKDKKRLSPKVSSNKVSSKKKQGVSQ